MISCGWASLPGERFEFQHLGDPLILLSNVLLCDILVTEFLSERVVSIVKKQT